MHLTCLNVIVSLKIWSPSSDEIIRPIEKVLVDFNEHICKFSERVDMNVYINETWEQNLRLPVCITRNVEAVVSQEITIV